MCGRAFGAAEVVLWVALAVILHLPRIGEGATSFPPYGVPQGLSPSSVAITRDGQLAFVSCDLSEAVYKVRLTDLTILGDADLSEYFPMENELVALDQGESRLFVYSTARRMLVVLDTRDMSVVGIIEDVGAIDMLPSRHTGRLLTWDGGGTVRMWDTATLTSSEHRNNAYFFFRIRESTTDPAIWYVLFATQPGGQLGSFGVYDHEQGVMKQVVPMLRQDDSEWAFDLCVLPGERQAYVATFGGWYTTEYRGFGWLHAIDLTTGAETTQLIDGGAMHLVASPSGSELYVGCGWPVPNTNNVLVVDTSHNQVSGRVDLGIQPWGWPFTQVNDLELDPADPRYLVALTADANSLSKVRLDGSEPARVLIFSRAERRPHLFTRQVDQDRGLALLTLTENALDLDLATAIVRRTVRLPRIYANTYSFDAAFTSAGRLLVTQSEYVVEVDPSDMHEIARHPLPTDARFWHFVLSHDERRLYSVTYQPQGQVANVFVAVSTTDYRTLARVTLDGSNHAFWPFELPGGDKLYLVGGEPGGAVKVHVIDAGSLAVNRTLTFDEPGLRGISAGPYNPFAYDASTHRLFVGATQVILVIDTEGDSIVEAISLSDLRAAIGVSNLTPLNAIGLTYLPATDRLVIAHLDGSFLSTYDLKAKHFLPKVTSLKGFMPSWVVTDRALTRLFSLNTRSDSISVVNLSTMDVEKVIDIERYLVPHVPRRRLSPSR